MDEPELCQRDFDAADEVLRRNPVDGRIAEETRELLAQLHAGIGRSSFRLYYDLRKPRGKYEEWSYQFFHGQITKEAFRDNMRRRAERPADQEMLDELFPQIESLLQQYGMGLCAAARTRSSQCSLWQRKKLEDEVSKHLLRTRRKFTLDRQELITLSKFLDEVRFESGLGNARFGKFTASNAKDLTHLVFKRAIQHWQSCQEIAHRSQTQEHYLYSTTAAKLLFGPNGPGLPTPQDLLTLLVEEWTAARVALRKQAGRAEAVEQKNEGFVIAQAAIHVENAQLHLDLQSLMNAESKAKEAKSTREMSVAHWSDLAVGIDQDFWAMSPAPELGKTFFKSKAHRLNIPVGQLRETLKAFADSATGSSVPIAELLRVLKKLPPGSNLAKDSRAKPGEIQAEITAELRNQTAAARIELNRTLTDLGRKFRKFVDGPKRKPDSCFYLTDQDACCGFVVQFIITHNGNSTFGPKA